MTPAERAAQLVQLAGSPFAEEARTSAYLACKLIREHGLRLVGGEAPRAYQDPRSAEHTQEAPPFVAGGACRATARYQCTCLDCGARIDEGATLWWMRGVGGVHERCSPHVLYPRHGR